MITQRLLYMLEFGRSLGEPKKAWKARSPELPDEEEWCLNQMHPPWRSCDEVLADREERALSGVED